MMIKVVKRERREDEEKETEKEKKREKIVLDVEKKRLGKTKEKTKR